MRVTILGCGDAFGSGGRFNTSFHIAAATGQRVAVDFGATTMVALRQRGIVPDSLDAVIVSHLHGDHFGGLPFLLLHLEHEARRERPLTIAGPPGIGPAIDEAMRVFFGGIPASWRFPLHIVEMPTGEATEVLGLSVETFEVAHGGVLSHALRLDDGERVVAYSGDTSWVPVLGDVARNADLFIMECYDVAYACPTHTDWQTLKAHLGELKPKRMMLTHLGEDMLAHQDTVRGEAPDVGVLADGMVFDL
jgi:ribonuclease BN (tRNA processing enzyme)